MSAEQHKETGRERDKEEQVSAEEAHLTDSEEESISPPCIGPGPCLCEVREQLGLNRAKVGQQLGLTEAAVKDLEKNRFERFPSSVYVRGYLKNYAKTLGESESEIIAIYDQFCEENNLDSGKSTLEPLPEQKGLGVTAKILIGIAICCAIAAVLASFADFI